MDSVKLPSGMPSLKDGMDPRPEILQDWIQNFCQERKVKRKQEWESHREALERMKESKEQQHHQQSQDRKGCHVCSDATELLKELELL